MKNKQKRKRKRKEGKPWQLTVREGADLSSKWQIEVGEWETQSGRSKQREKVPTRRARPGAMLG